MNIYSKRYLWKQLIVLFAVCIGLGSLAYTELLVNQLQNEERRKIELWAKATELLANTSDPNTDLSFAFEVIMNNNSIPVILATEYDSIISFRNLDSTKSLNYAYLKEMLSEMKSEQPPISVQLQNTQNFIYFSHSDMLRKLQIFPFVQLGVIGLFIIVSYVAFSSSRKAEQDQVWVGMSKETAHQLGTPISSLMAWLELLKSKLDDPEILVEIEKDLLRLQEIANRFSKIGSSPLLEATEITQQLSQCVAYMKPRLSKKIQLLEEYPTSEDTEVPLCAPLFTWVIENILRNAADAMEAEGTIALKLSVAENWVFIDIKNSGKPIPRSKFKTIFEPGFTTKKRGWGLGLSLCKRIIESYHGGNIYVLESSLASGTVFRIELLRKT